VDLTIDTVRAELSKISADRQHAVDAALSTPVGTEQQEEQKTDEEVIADARVVG